MLSLSTACLYHLPLGTIFRLAAEAGFEGVELVISPRVRRRGARAIAELSRTYGLRILSIHQALLGLGLSGSGPERMTDAVTLALALDCPCVVVHGTWAKSWSLPEAQAWMHALEVCRQRLDGQGTCLSIENHGHYTPSDDQGVLGRLADLVAFCRQGDLAITLDTCHAGTYAQGLLASYQAVRERLANVHLSDLAHARPPTGNRRWRAVFHHHRMLGEGDLPLAPFLAQLRADGYPGPLSLEVSPWALGAWSLRRVRQRLAQAVDYVRRAC